MGGCTFWVESLLETEEELLRLCYDTRSRYYCLHSISYVMLSTCMKYERERERKAMIL